MTRINTNVQSLLARRTLAINNLALNTSLERLSTGLRINSGRDDPAGLIASEVLRASVRATSTAIDNAHRADTIVAVAEGGLQEVSSLLLNLEKLIDQTSNQAGITEEEEAANQLQIDSILASINRLADATAFGNKKLLNGNLEFTTSGVNINEPTGAALTDITKLQINAAKIPAGAFRTVNVEIVTPSTIALVSAVGAGTTGGAGNPLAGTLSDTTTLQIRGTIGSEILSFASGTSMAQIATAVNASSQLTGVSATASAAAGGPASLVLQSTDFGSDQIVSIDVLENVAAWTSQAAATLANGTDGTVTINGANAIVQGLDASVRVGSLSADVRITSTFNGTSGNSTTFEITGGGAIFSISPNVGLVGMETLGIPEVSTGNLGDSNIGFLASLGSGLTNDLASSQFSNAQAIVRSAIDQVATLRGRLGGFQKDTLATTINSLGVSRENIIAAESAIRDADFATETSNLTRAQILVNASMVTLRLANSQPQSVLSLLG